MHHLRRLSVHLLLTSLAAIGCSSETDDSESTDVSCTTNTECGPGKACNAGACIVVTSETESATYTAWSEWSACEPGCGTSFRQRQRDCQGASGALSCNACGGACLEAEPCESTEACTYSYGPWSFFSDCSLACDGAEVRTRSCSRSDGLSVDCSFCGGACAESRACNDVPDCTHRYGTWQSPSECSTTCGTGTRERTRECFDTSEASADCASCGGNCVDTVGCSDTSSCTYAYTEWSDFGDCSASCGEGTRRRNRDCERSDGATVGCNACGGECEETQACLETAGCDRPVAWTFTVSSVYSNYTGHLGTHGTTTGGLSDTLTNGTTSVWGSNASPNENIVADFGRVVTVNEVLVAPIDSGFGGWGPSYADGVRIESSTNGTDWTPGATISGTQNGVTTPFAINTQARYVRLIRNSSYIGLGELWFR